MAIYRTLYYTDVVVGVGGRMTIPQDMREDLGIAEGDSLGADCQRRRKPQRRTPNGSLAC